MIVIVEAMWPPNKANEIGKAFLDASPLPDYLTMRGPYVNSYVRKGTRAITIYEFDAAKIEDANKAIGKRYIAYASVSGFTYEIRTWGETQAALEMIGLA